MIVYIVRCPNTVFGEVIHEFDSLSQTVYWVGVCERNKVPYSLEFRFEDRPKQLDLPF